jgi:type II secretory pathway pseudopilin PulG
MRSMRSTPPSNAESGFSLVELLVGTTLMLLVLGTTGVFFAAARNFISDQILHIETQQGLRAAMDSMVRDLRLAGACLPTSGDFVTLDPVASTNNQIVVRTGQVRPDETCIQTVLTSDLAAGASQLSVQSASGFMPGMRVYIRQSNGATGEVINITSVDTTNNVLGKAANLTCPDTVGGCPTPAYPAGSGVYAVDEREYAVDASNPALPVLTLTANGAAPVPFAFGIEGLQLQYELARNCDSQSGCDVVNVPATEGDFALVNQIYVTLTARSRTPSLNGQYYRVTRTVSAKPRNLLPG